VYVTDVHDPADPFGVFHRLKNFKEIFPAFVGGIRTFQQTFGPNASLKGAFDVEASGRSISSRSFGFRPFGGGAEKEEREKRTDRAQQCAPVQRRKIKGGDERANF